MMKKNVLVILHFTPCNESESESESESDSDQDLTICDRFNPQDDWYVAKKYPWSAILALVYLARFCLINKDHQPHKVEGYTKSYVVEVQVL